MLEIPELAKDFEEMIKDWSDGFRKIQLLRVAVKMKLFDKLKEAKAIHDIKIGDEKLTRLMLDCLTALGLIRKADGKYMLSEVSKTFLTSDSPYSQLRCLDKLFSDLEMWTELENILKKGPVTVERGKFFSESVIHSMAQHALLGELQKTVEVVSKYINTARRLLDLGGGHGLYSIAFTKINPHLTATVFDLPEVIEKAREYVQKYGAERVEFMAGDFFVDDIGAGYDVIFSSYNPSGKSVWMIDKIRKALNPGGIYINKQYFRSNSKEVDLCDLEWNLWRFGEIEKAEKKYTFEKDLDIDEYMRKLVNSGFEVLEVLDFGEANMIVARKK